MLRLPGEPDAPIDINRYSNNFYGITVYDNSTLEAEYTSIRNLVDTGTGALYRNIYPMGGSAVINHTLLIGSEYDGIYIANGQLDLFESQIVNIDRHGLWQFYIGGSCVSHQDDIIADNGSNGEMNFSPQNTTIDAANNFWGAANNPAHATNPPGGGRARAGTALQLGRIG